MSDIPDTPVQLNRIIKLLSPHIGQALRGVRNAYAGYPDDEVIATCRAHAPELASEIASVLSMPVSGRQLRLICVDTESWAERQAWERLLAHIAVLSAMGPARVPLENDLPEDLTGGS